jgi:hypothetical protein
LLTPSLFTINSLFASNFVPLKQESSLDYFFILAVGDFFSFLFFSFVLINPFDFAQGDGNKRSSLKIKSAKTTSKRRSAARAVRPSSSTRGLLPLYFFVVFHAFYLRASVRVLNG